MAIVEMSKIRLMGLAYHKESILNALHKTGCVELVDTAELPDTVASDSGEKEAVTAKYERVKSAVDFLSSKIEEARAKKSEADGKAVNLGHFFVSYDRFNSIMDSEGDLLFVIKDLEELENALALNRAEKVKLNNLRAQLTSYVGVPDKFSDFKDTDFTKVFFGSLKQDSVNDLKKFLADFGLTALCVLKEGANAIISVVSHIDEADAVAAKLSGIGFTKCPFVFDKNAQDKISEIDEKILSKEKEDDKISEKVLKHSESIYNLKILSDYYKFCLEKAEDGEKFRCTGSTFILDGYLPKDKEKDVLEAAESVTKAVFVEFSAPEKDDVPPTLVKNNPVVRQAEFVTDLYSSPNYREMDPNKIVFFFFMLFMGVIMADVGYGVLMIVLGIVLAKRIKVDSGTRRLWYIIAIGGIFTVVFGLLFNSFFGWSLPYNAPLPSPVPDGDSTDGLMTILLGCLGLGVLQIAVGYLCKAINCFRNKDIVGGIFEGLVWVIFFIGFVFAAFNFLVNYLMPDSYRAMNAGVKTFFNTMQMPGIIMVAGAVVIAALTAGRKEKGFGKFSKGFGAVYGIINIMSDILSYARLFGLMLSGMIIASTFNDMGMSLLGGGSFGYVAGPLVIVIGHVFNIAMGVLGAYIHDSRLQYIEFFSKFYTGEGEKFKPLGSEFDFIYLTK